LSDPQARKDANRRLALKLLWVVGGAILFTAALVPLYNVMCRVTGLNGKSEDGPEAAGQVLKVDTSRWVTVEFTGNVMPGLGWNFTPRQSSLRLHPGQIELATFEARNNTNRASVGQAVASISPGQAARYFRKIECFCFQRQPLKPGESKEMPVRFYISPDLPANVQSVTLSYAFFSALPAAN
jgi:cytochrome c oxidase assembly protein subunit 11